MQRLALSTGWATLLWVGIFATPSWGQRVQIPATNPSPFPTAPELSYAPSTTYGAPSLSGGVTVSPPPSFDAYAAPSVSGTMGPPPASVPYNYSPAPALSYPQSPTAPAGPWQAFPVTPTNPQQGGLFPDGLPFDWQPGTYSYQDREGNLVRFQKFLQRVGFEHTWLYGSSSDDLGLNRSELAATFGIPVLHNIDTPLLITPGFAFNWLEGPVGDPAGMPRGPDLPGQLYDAYLDASWYPRPFEWFGAELGFRTGVWSDFDSINSDSVRFLGRGLGVVSLTPQLDLLVGVVYLDRLRVKLLPAGGLHWRPDNDWDLYIVFPNPKVRRRFQTVGNTEWWWYVAGEYGGGSWTVDRSGLSDRIDYNDLRAVFGLEWEGTGQVRGHLEVGYVFDREVLFESSDPAEFKPDDTVMLRAGIDF